MLTSHYSCSVPGGEPIFSFQFSLLLLIFLLLLVSWERVVLNLVQWREDMKKSGYGDVTHILIVGYWTINAQWEALLLTLWQVLTPRREITRKENSGDKLATKRPFKKVTTYGQTEWPTWKWILRIDPVYVIHLFLHSVKRKPVMIVRDSFFGLTEYN